MLPQFLNKQGEVALRIVSCLSELEIGSRIPNISDLSSSLNVGAGTVQTALKMLETENLIKLQSRGHQGTTLEYMDRVLLWKLTEQPWISGSMPLPYTSRMEGFATALYRQFENVGIPFNIQYMRGGKARLQKLSMGAFNFAICSKTGFLLAQEDYPNLEILFEFGDESYMDQPAVVFSNENETEIRDGMKIGIDVHSYDHVFLNKYVCNGKDVQFVPLKYSELSVKLKSGEIDASLWNMDELREKFSAQNIHAIPSNQTEEIRGAGTAVLVVRRDDKRIKLLLPDILDINNIREIQDDVINKRILPAY